MSANKPVIKRFNLRLETRTTRVSRRDYDFEKPKILPEGAVKSEFAPDLEDYDYPGRFTTRERGKLLSTRALERHHSDYKLAEGKGDELLFQRYVHLSDNWNAAKGLNNSDLGILFINRPNDNLRRTVHPNE